MTEALDDIKRLKTQAKNRRDRGQYDRAVRVLKEAISRGEKAKSETKSETSDWKGLTAELADCYGIMGGVYRRWALQTGSSTERSEYLRQSFLAYDEGYRLDSDPRYGSASSYNMLNRLISMIFLQPRLLSSSQEVETELAKQSSKLRQDLQETRKFIKKFEAPHDYWALADLALLDLFLDAADPVRAYASFNAESPPDFAYESALSVLVPLSQLELPMSSHLAEAVTLLKNRRATLATKSA